MSNDHKDCYGCTERTLGCHAVCEIYKKNSEKNNELGVTQSIIRNY